MFYGHRRFLKLGTWNTFAWYLYLVIKTRLGAYTGEEKKRKGKKKENCKQKANIFWTILFFIIYLTSDVSLTIIPFSINLLRNSVAISRKMGWFLTKKKKKNIVIERKLYENAFN